MGSIWSMLLHTHRERWHGLLGITHNQWITMLNLMHTIPDLTDVRLCDRFYDSCYALGTNCQSVMWSHVNYNLVIKYSM